MFGSDNIIKELRDDLAASRGVVSAKDQVIADLKSKVEQLGIELADNEDVNSCSASVYFKKIQAVAIYRGNKKLYSTHDPYYRTTSTCVEAGGKTIVTYVAPGNQAVFELAIPCSKETHEQLVYDFNEYIVNDQAK